VAERLEHQVAPLAAAAPLPPPRLDVLDLHTQPRRYLLSTPFPISAPPPTSP
jgi:hypothetical protein